MIAIKAHKWQKRRDGRPYITHPIRVAMSLKDEWQTVMALAVLHDVLEDCTDWALLIWDWGLWFLMQDLVKLTKKDWEEYSIYIDRVWESGRLIREIKVADIMDNMTDYPSERQIDKYTLALERLL